MIHGAEEDFWGQHPRTAELVIEVCVTSHDYDRWKLQAYATAGVKECWLVFGPEREIEVCSQPCNGQYAKRVVFRSGGTITSTALPQFALALDTLFVK